MPSRSLLRRGDAGRIEVALEGWPEETEEQTARIREAVGDVEIHEGASVGGPEAVTAPIVAEVAVAPSRLDAVLGGADDWRALMGVGTPGSGSRTAAASRRSGRASRRRRDRTAIRGPGGLGEAPVAAPRCIAGSRPRSTLRHPGSRAILGRPSQTERGARRRHTYASVKPETRDRSERRPHPSPRQGARTSHIGSRWSVGPCHMTGMDGLVPAIGATRWLDAAPAVRSLSGTHPRNRVRTHPLRLPSRGNSPDSVTPRVGAARADARRPLPASRASYRRRSGPGARRARTREERRTRYHRDADVLDHVPREPDVVREAEARDVRHHVVGTRGRLDLEPRLAERLDPQVPSLTVLVRGLPVVLLGEAQGDLTRLLEQAPRRGRKSWTDRMPRDRGAGATTHPTRQPVTEHVFDSALDRHRPTRGRPPRRVACTAPSYMMSRISSVNTTTPHRWQSPAITSSSSRRTPCPWGCSACRDHDPRVLVERGSELCLVERPVGRAGHGARHGPEMIVSGP